LMASKNPSYFSPGDVEPLGDTGVDVFVLGPPASEKSLRKQDIAKGDAYHKQQLAFFDGLEAMLGSVEAGFAEGTGDLENRPFDARKEIPIAAARESEFFQTVYGFGPDHAEYFRSIDDLAHETLGSLALRMDKYINNTSLVLAFRLPTGKVLLFPGDAQGGNWKSWADPAAPLKFAAEELDAHDLLAQTVLYKVSHHGSHNATPRTFGLDRMTHPELRALVPVDGAIARGAGYGEMPLAAIMGALAEKGGAVFRSDGEIDDAAKKFFRFADKTISIQMKSNAEPIERPLYCETSFELS